MSLSFRAAVWGVALAAGAAGQSVPFDNSGNRLLNGTYYFRETAYIVGSATGAVSRALAVYGNITFDGAGGYSIRTQAALDSSVGRVQSFSANGTYAIAASGYGYISSPVSNGDFVYGLVSKGIFVGSSTEADFNDFFVAAPLASPAPTNASFRGSYSLVYFNPASQISTMSGASFQLNPDGNGAAGDVNFSGYFAGGGSRVYTQTSRNIRYSFSNGGCVLFFPNDANANFVAENEYLYFSPDGNFVFGGSPTNFDFIVGIKAAPAGATQKLGGLYYQAGMNLDASLLAARGFVDLDSYYGSFNTAGTSAIFHERFNSPFNTTALSSTYAGKVPESITGGYADTGESRVYAMSADGAVRIGIGVGPYLGMTVAMKAEPVAGVGVFLDPAGVINSASFAPFTSGVSPGEFVTLYGSLLAESTVVANTLPFPTTLGGVEVRINDVRAPLYYVSPGQIAAIIPFGITTAVAKIQVINNGRESNAVTQFVAQTTPGVFTLSATGIGGGAIQHGDGSTVTASKPARPGETVAMFVSGLGAVKPTVADGSAGPVDPLSLTAVTPVVRVNGLAAKVVYSGLAPYLAGLYQVNFEVPAAATSGDNSLQIAGPDSFTVQTTIPVSSAAASLTALTPLPTRPQARPLREGVPALVRPRIQGFR